METSNKPFAAYPTEPVDIAEWEDLLVRFEIMPRALRNTLERVSVVAAAREALLRLLAREEWAVETFAALREGSAASAPPAEAQVAMDPGGDLEDLAVRIAQRRAKNFAQVQRRGLEVWGWSAPLGEHGRVTTFQLLRWLVAGDVAALAALRGAAGAGSGVGAC